MLEPFKGIFTRQFMSPRGRLALLRDISVNCIDLMVLGYTQNFNSTKQLITGTCIEFIEEHSIDKLCIHKAEIPIILPNNLLQ